MTSTTAHRPATWVSPMDLKVTQSRVIKSEWTKFRSLRSTIITLLVMMVLIVGLGALITAVTAGTWNTASPGDRADFNAITRSLGGVEIAELAVGVLGVMLVSGEYATGMIRASLTAVPRRLPVLWAKMTVFSAVVAVASLVSVFAAFFLGQSLLHSKHIGVSIADGSALRDVLGAALYLVLIGIIGMAFGALLRNTAAGISAMVALLFVIPPLLNLLSTSWYNHIAPYMPSNAGQDFWANPTGVHLSALNGLLVLLAWTAAFVAAGAIRLKRQDA